MRWHERDAIVYAPSLHARQAPRRKANADGEPLEPEPLVSESALLGGEPPTAEAGLPGNSPFSNE